MYDTFAKKLTVWLFVAAVCVFGMAYALYANSGTKHSNFNFISNFTEASDYTINKEETIPADKIKELRIKTSSVSINCIPVETSEIKAHFYGDVRTSNEAAIPELAVETSGNTVEIVVKRKDNTGSFSYSGNLKLDIYIPVSYSQELKAEASSGSIYISGLKVDKLDAKASSGSLSVTSTAVSEANLQASSGSIKISDFSGELNCKSSSGSINAEYSRFNNDVKLQASSGSVTLKLPEDSEFQLKARVSSGSIKCDFPIRMTESSDRKLLEGIVKSDRNKIDITTSSGSIQLLRSGS